MKNRNLVTRIGLIAALLGTLAACNTTAGIGRDIESVGNSVAGAADGAK